MWAEKTNGGRTRPAKTVPVRFIMACKSGHIDDFPFYEWVHNRGDKSDKCPESDACLYLGGSEVHIIVPRLEIRGV